MLFDFDMLLCNVLSSSAFLIADSISVVFMFLSADIVARYIIGVHGL